MSTPVFRGDYRQLATPFIEITGVSIMPNEFSRPSIKLRV